MSRTGWSSLVVRPEPSGWLAWLPGNIAEFRGGHYFHTVTKLEIGYAIGVKSEFPYRQNYIPDIRWHQVAPLLGNITDLHIAKVALTSDQARSLSDATRLTQLHLEDFCVENQEEFDFNGNRKVDFKAFPFGPSRQLLQIFDFAFADFAKHAAVFVGQRVRRSLESRPSRGGQSAQVSGSEARQELRPALEISYGPVEIKIETERCKHQSMKQAANSGTNTLV